MASLPAEVVVAGVVGSGGRVSPIYLRRAPPWAKKPAQICKKPYTAENPTPRQAAIRVGLGLLAREYERQPEDLKQEIREKTGLPGASGYIVYLEEEGVEHPVLKTAEDYFKTLPEPVGKRRVRRTYNTINKLINIVNKTLGREVRIRTF